MQSWPLVILSLIAYAVADYDACRIQTNDGYIDLNPARSSAGYYKVIDPSLSLWEYYVQICDSASNFNGIDRCKKNYPDAKGYQMFSDKSDCYPMASKSSSDATLKLLHSDKPSGGVVLTYDSIDYDNFKRSVNIQIACDPDAGNDSPLKWVEEVYEWGNSIYYFSGKSKYACPGAGGNSNLPLGHYGVGGLLITLALIALALYFIIGALVLKFKFQKTGTELIINFEFWKDLPFLIRDGGLFIVDGVKILIAKVKGGNSAYSEV